MINIKSIRQAIIEGFSKSLLKKAIAIADKSTGDYDHAYIAIEKLKKGLASHPTVAAALKTANESIALAEDDLEEAVAVDMRTKGYKEAIARSITKEAKKKLNAENAKTLQDANNALLGKNENMTAGGNDSTGPIAGHDKPLSKKKKIMKRKGFKESIELDESKPAGYGNTDVRVGDEFEKNKLTLKVISVSGKKVTVKKKGKKQSIMPITQFDTWTKINESVKLGESIESDIKDALKGRKDKILSVDQWHQILYNTSKKMWSKDKIKSALKKLKVVVKESVDLEEGVSSEAKAVMKEINKHLQILKTELKTSDENQDWKARLNRIEGIIGKVKRAADEAVSMKNAKGIGFGKKGGYDKYVTLAKKKNAKSHKDVLKALSREGLGKEELDNVADYVMNALGESVELGEAKGSDCTIQNDGRNNIAVCIDGLSFADARKGTRAAMMNIDDFKKKAKVTWADAKGKPTLPAVKKELKALGAKNFYAKWQADSSSYKDDSVEIWYTK